MNPQNASWSRVATGTVALFAVILAFLAGKVVSGGDPTQAKASAPAPATTQAEPQDDPYEQSQPLPDEQQQPEPGPVTTQQS